MNTDESLSPGDVPVAGVARNSFKKRRMEFLCKTLQSSTPRIAKFRSSSAYFPS